TRSCATPPRYAATSSWRAMPTNSGVALPDASTRIRPTFSRRNDTPCPATSISSLTSAYEVVASRCAPVPTYPSESREASSRAVPAPPTAAAIPLKASTAPTASATTDPAPWRAGRRRLLTALGQPERRVGVGHERRVRGHAQRPPVHADHQVEDTARVVAGEQQGERGDQHQQADHAAPVEGVEHAAPIGQVV